MAKIKELGWIEGSNILQTKQLSSGKTKFQRADGKTLPITDGATFKNWVTKETSSNVLGSNLNYDVVTGAYSKEFPGLSFWGGRDNVSVANSSMPFVQSNNSSWTTAGSDLLIGSSVRDSFTFTGVSGYDFLDGGAGLDVMNVKSTSKDFYKSYDVQKVATILNKDGLISRDTKTNQTQFIKITDKTSGQYTLLANIEQVWFEGDKTLMCTGIGNNTPFFANGGYIANESPARFGI